jgi:hypothetical protein
MAIMINCAQDWTYDLYVRDVKTYGAEDKSNGENYNAYFVAYMKRAAARFLANWKEQHDGKLYDLEYVGDAFARSIREWFSDFYKDTYRQRPHLPMWFYVHPLGLPMQEDTARMFCAKPVDRAIQEARTVRESI